MDFVSFDKPPRFGVDFNDGVFCVFTTALAKDGKAASFSLTTRCPSLLSTAVSFTEDAVNSSSGLTNGGIVNTNGEQLRSGVPTVTKNQDNTFTASSVKDTAVDKSEGHLVVKENDAAFPSLASAVVKTQKTPSLKSTPNLGGLSNDTKSMGLSKTLVVEDKGQLSWATRIKQSPEKATPTKNDEDKISINSSKVDGTPLQPRGEVTIQDQVFKDQCNTAFGITAD
jgi:hypothetical protein